MSRLRPVFGWVGGKQRMVSKYARALGTIMCRVYIEPFCGSAGVYLGLSSLGALTVSDYVLLCDIDPDLCNTHASVKMFPDVVSQRIESHREMHCRDYYMAVRDAYAPVQPRWTERQTDPEKAGDYIYIVQCAFGKNPAKRMDGSKLSSGYGGDEAARTLPNRDRILRISQALERAHFLNVSYENSILFATRGDYVYADPPYMFPHGDVLRDGYVASGASFQQRTEHLLSMLDDAHNRGARFGLSNMADPRLIRWATRRGYRIHVFDTMRSIRMWTHGKESVKEVYIEG